MKPIILTTAFVFTATTALASMDVKEVDVNVSLDDIENAAATEVWKSVETDLEAAIAARLVSQLSDTGAEISVDLDEVSLASNFENAFGIEDAVLAGQVEVRTPDDGMVENYTLTVMAEDVVRADPDTGDVVAVEISADAIYDAMIAGFADNVATKVQ